MTAGLSDRIALAETAYMAEVSSFFILWFNSRRSNDPSGFGNCTRCSVTSCSTIVLSGQKRMPIVRRGSGEISMPFRATRATNGLRQRLYSSTPRRSNSVSRASKTISTGITARLVQRIIKARAAIRYSVMQGCSQCEMSLSSRLLFERDVKYAPDFAFSRCCEE